MTYLQRLGNCVISLWKRSIFELVLFFYQMCTLFLMTSFKLTKVRKLLQTASNQTSNHGLCLLQNVIGKIVYQ